MNENKTNINWYPGHMAKTKREIKEKIELIDIVYEIIDSRMPISSKIPLEDIIDNKKKIIIATKYDLCDKEKTDKILNSYSDTPVLKFNLKNSNGKEISNLINLTNNLLDDINKKRKEKGLKPRTFRALVVGAPNVGKSTLINRIKGKNVQSTGNKAGVTKSLNWIKVGNTIELLDTPGILYPKITSEEVGLNLASLTSINENILDKEAISKYILMKLKNNYPDILKSRYKLTNVDKEIDEIIEDIAANTNSFQKGSILDLEKTYGIIINDLKEGRISNITFD